MAKAKAQVSFLEKTINSLSPEEFDIAVQIFQKYYLKNEAINVNGPNDGGCDIKIFQNKREQKKCVQLTVQKKWEDKLKQELQKAEQLIITHNYSDKYDFFCSQIISETKIEEYKKYALDNFYIDLTIYEAHRLSQLDCSELRNYLYSIHKDVIIQPDQLTIDKTTKSIYDFLSNGKGSSDIKNDIVNSFIISILFKKESLSINELLKELQNQLNKEISDITHTINLLKSEKKIVKDTQIEGNIKLSDDERENARSIFTYASYIEKDFVTKFEQLVARYDIQNITEILEHLKSLYRDYYRNDIEIFFKHSQNVNDVFKSFDTYLSSIISDKETRFSLINDIKKLCEENTYLNRIIASESFLNLYRSNKLEQYIKSNKKSIFIDTPIVVYLICSFFGVDNNSDWNDPLYRAVKNLFDQTETNLEKHKIFVMHDYIREVAGELTKAYQIANLEDAPFFKNLGGTNNSFYNYYRWLRDNKNVVEIDNEINCFDDFLDNLSIEFDTHSKNDNIITQIANCLEYILEELNIEIVPCPYFEDFPNAKMTYEKLLYNRKKSETAIINDVKQILYLFSEGKAYDNLYFSTWDITLYQLRDKLMEKNDKKYFPIYNPAKLSNKIALENFNIDSSAITNDIFVYADKTFGISNKVKSLLEIIAPIFGNKNIKKCKIIKSLGEIRKQQQKETLDYNVTELYKQSLPIEEVLTRMIPSKEQQEKDGNIFEKFQAFIMDDTNADYIIDLIIKESSAFTNNKPINLTDFFERVSKVDKTFIQ